jgi:hypothetical protein
MGRIDIHVTEDQYKILKNIEYLNVEINNEDYSPCEGTVYISVDCPYENIGPIIYDLIKPKTYLREYNFYKNWTDIFIELVETPQKINSYKALLELSR